MGELETTTEVYVIPCAAEEEVIGWNWFKISGLMKALPIGAKGEGAGLCKLKAEVVPETYMTVVITEG